MEHGLERSPDVERAAARLARPRSRAALACKRLLDVTLALAMLLAALPVFVIVLLLLGFAGDGLIERRTRLGRNGKPIVLTRFRELPGGAFGRALQRAGARELPLLLTVLRGRLSFVGPRVAAPGTSYTGPRRLMTPGLIGPRSGLDDDEYVEQWSLWRDARLLAGRGSVHHSVSNSSS
ncbi:sugar transferase [Solirubrobacter deserti]|uniref:Sugar transferase n=1 Tax=Solirubrobacter deserti TaxID=2282478 RepID=A0ABT4RHG3_9ACTN|nr:sugar transferase [Solirubrobacter deserti]MDA0137930.1 sugar transferase [Solirubrobacter deserti]